MRLRSHVWWVGLTAMVSLVVLIGEQLRQRWEPMAQAEHALSELQAMDSVADVLHELQRERGLSSAWLGGAPVQVELTEQQRRTDAAFRRAGADARLGWLSPSPLVEHRREVAQRHTTAAASRSLYTQLIGQTMDRAEAHSHAQDDAQLRLELRLHADLLRAKEHLGQLRAGMAAQLANHEHGARAIIESQRHVAVFDEYVSRYLAIADDARRAALDQVLGGAAMAALQMHLHAHAASNAGASVELPTTRQWFDAATLVIDEVRQLELVSLQRARLAARGAIERQRTRLLVSTGVLLAAWGLVAAMLLLSLSRLMKVLSQLIVNTQRLLGQVGGLTQDSGFDDGAGLEAGWAQVLDRAERLQQQASVDALTGVFNRRGLDIAYARELGRAERHGRALSLLLLDLDHFKQVNDVHGHAAGDRVLRETCARLRRALRRDDTLARWGGEEFVVLAPESDEDAAWQLAEKLRHAVAERPFGGVGPRTVSIGVAQWREGDSLDRLCNRADLALYTAKSTGRNRCTKASALPGEPHGSGPGLKLVPR